MTEKAMAIANFEPTGDGQIALVEGDFIEVYEKAKDEDGNEEDSWWYGVNLRGKEEGWFPANCVQKRGGKIGERIAAEQKQQQQNQKSVKLAKPSISPKPMKLDNTTELLEQAATAAPVAIALETEPNKTSTVSHSSETTNHQPKLTTPVSRKSTLVDPQQFTFRAKLVEELIIKRRSTLQDASSIDIFNRSQQIQNQVVEQQPSTDRQSHRESHYRSSYFEDDEDDDENWDDDEETSKPAVVRQSSTDSSVTFTVDFAVAFVSYEPTGPGQLALKIGDVVEVHEKNSDPNWWRGRLKQGSSSSMGWFPASYVKLLEKEYSQHIESQQQVPKSRKAVRKSQSLRSQLLNGPMKILQKVAATAAVMSPTSPHWHSPTSPNSPSISSIPSAVKTPSPIAEHSQAASKFYTFKDRGSGGGDVVDKGMEMADDGDSDYGTADQVSLFSYSQLLYTVQTMSIGGDEAAATEKVDPRKKRATRRQNIIYELVSAEEKYIKDIYFTLTNFQQSLASNGLLTEDEAVLVFRNLRQIYDANYELFDALNARLGTANGVNTSRICDVLLEHLPPMISIYSEYIAGHQTAIAKIKVKCLGDGYFADFLDSVSREHNEYYLPLEQYLAKPMQRLLQLPNLMEQLLKSTEEDSEDYLDCQRTVDVVKGFCRTVDDALLGPSGMATGSTTKAWSRQYECLSWLQTHLNFRVIEHLVDFNSETAFLGPRTLLYASFYTDLVSRKVVALFLLNDMLIVGLPQKRLTNTIHQVASFFDIPQATNCKYQLLYERPILLEDVAICGRSSIADTNFELTFTFSSSCLTSKGNSVNSGGGTLSNASLKLHAASFEQYDALLEKLTAAKAEYSRMQQLISRFSFGRSNSVEFVGRPLAMLSLESIEAVQLYTRSYALNAYCKVAIGTDWAPAAHSQVSVTKPFHVDLSPGRPASKSPTSRASPTSPSSSKSSSSQPPPPSSPTIIWTTNYLLSVFRPEDCLLIRVYNQARYSPHQLLGETSMSLGELITASKRLQGFTKGLPLVLPNGPLGEQLMANYRIRPCLLVKFDIL